MLDFLIIGQGLAGTLLALEFERRGKTFVILDEGNEYSSSKVAAGIFNPVIAKRLTLTWKAKELIEFNQSYYPKLADQLQTGFYHPLKCLLAFDSAGQQNDWMVKLSDERFRRHFSDSDAYKNVPSLDFSHGGITIEDAGYVDTVALLNEARKRFITASQFRQEVMDHSLLEISSDKIKYKDITANQVIFCDGYKNTSNPLFSFLPYKLAKGEVLTIQSKELKLSHLYQKGIYIVPLGNELYKVGATYEWNDLSVNISEAGKSWIKNKLDEVIKVPYEIIDHKAGVRPATKDRRPYLGVHPAHPNVFIFNGWGSKGVLLVPYFAEKFCDFVIDKIPLDIEVDIRRVR